MRCFQRSFASKRCSYLLRKHSIACMSRLSSVFFKESSYFHRKRRFDYCLTNIKNKAMTGVFAPGMTDCLLFMDFPGRPNKRDRAEAGIHVSDLAVTD